MNNLTQKITDYSKKVLEKVKHEHRAKFITDDVNFMELYEDYLQLGSFSHNLANMIRDSVGTLQKTCAANKELSSFIQQHVEGPLKDSFDIQSIVDKFATLQSMVHNSNLNELMDVAQRDAMKPLLRDRELETSTNQMLDGKIIDQRLSEALTGRTQERAIMLAQVILAVMEYQYNFFTSVSTMYADLYQSLNPVLANVRARKPGNVQRSHPQPPPKPTHNPPTHSIPPQPNVSQNRPQQPQPQPQQPPQNYQQKPVPSQPRNNSSGNYSVGHEEERSRPSVPTSAPVNQPPQPPAHVQNNSPSTSHATGNSNPTQNRSAPTANLDDIFGSNSSTQQAPLFSFDDAHHEPPITPHQANTASADPFFNFTNNGNGSTSSAPKSNNFFDDFNSFSTSSNTTKAPSSSDPFAFSTSQPTSAPKQNNDFDQLFGSSNPAPNPTPTQTSAAPKPASQTPEMTPEEEREAKKQWEPMVHEKVDAWAGNKKDNLRSLISTLHLILWEDSGWQQTSLGELVGPGALKKAYRKACLVVHPDKTRGKPLELQVLAQRVFELLQEAAKTAQW